MARFIGVLTVAGEELNERNRQLRALRDQTQSMSLDSWWPPYVIQFENGFSMLISVGQVAPYPVCAQLTNTQNRPVISNEMPAAEFCGRFVVTYGIDTYDGSVLHGAQSILLDENVEQYRQAFPDITCPFCASPETHYNRLSRVDNTIHQPVMCLHCNAAWTEVYSFNGLLTAEGTWQAPDQLSRYRQE